MISPRPASIAYLSLGSNLGDRKSNLREALRVMESSEFVRLISVSSLYLTKPVGVQEVQDDFLNVVVKIETTLRPHQLLDFLKGIEGRFGRKSGSHLQPRVLDLDILLYDDLVLHSEVLSIPHPRLTFREFILASLLEIEPELQNPVDAKKLSSYYEKLKGSQKVKLLEDKNWERG